MRGRRPWWKGLSTLGLVLTAAVAVAVGYRTAAGALARRIEAALGPGAAVRAVRLAGLSVVVDDLRVPAPAGWPVADALRIERLTLAPELRSLLGGSVRIARITAVRPFLVLRRTAAGVEVLPGLAATSDGAAAGAAPAVAIGRVAVVDGALELYDGTVARPPLRLRLDGIEGALDDITAPPRPGRSRLALAAVVRGRRRNGALRVDGWLDLARDDATAELELRGVDLVALQPYLLRATDARVVGGTADLQLSPVIRGGRLHAPGRLVLTGLALAPPRGGIETVLGMPRTAVVDLLRRGPDGVIDLAFTLDGDLGNPRFRLDEALATRLTAALGARLGVDAGGMAAGLGQLGGQGVAAAGRVADGMGRSLRNLFRRRPD
jgi:hypothetical protein